MVRLETLLHPSSYAQSIVAHPPLGTVTLGMLLLAALWVVLLFGTEMPLRRNYAGKRYYLGLSLAGLAGIPSVFLLVWLTLTFLTVGIARLLGHPLSFEALFCLLAIAIAPKYLGWLSCQLRDLSFWTHAFWRILSALILPWTVWRLWGVVSAAGPFNRWQTLIALTPCLAALLAVTFWEIASPPSDLHAAYPWRRARGRRVTVYYPKGQRAEDAEAVAREAEELLTRIERLLEFAPVPLTIGIFLCPDSESLGRFNRIKDTLAEGYGGADHISLVYGLWADIQAIVAHELTHTVSMQWLHPDMMPLLGEGLAEYGMAQTVGGPLPAAIRIPVPLALLAHTCVFFEALHVEKPEYSPAETYAHAAALVDYLIGRYDLDKFKALCLQTGSESKANQAAQLRKAVGEIYGLSLFALEQDWRREWIGPGRIEQT